MATLPNLPKVVNLGYSLKCSFLHLYQHVQVLFSLCHIQCTVIAYQYPIIGSCILPHIDLFGQCLIHGFCLPPANNISPTRYTSLHSDIMLYDRECIICHISEIGIVWVWFLLLTPSVSDISYPKYTANLHWVEVVIIKILINLAPTLGWFRRSFQMERCGSPYVCGVITPSGGRFSHVLNL